jgi:alkanesulfonate monooxygenase SsuD/methylene tetrahydromethanopterin reductase-like flavin-dependent oxidoreductase (luciferase family)
MDFPLRVGISLAPVFGPSQAADIEERGFDLLLVADHLFHYRVPDRPFLDAWMRLAAITQTTSRIRLGTLVTNLSWRQPVLIAKNAIAVDQLSGGRLELGVGCGAYADQAMVDGESMPPGERVRRLDEGLDVLDRLLSGNVEPFAGEFTRYDRASVAPGCVQAPRPALTVAAFGKRTLAVAARRADIWNCVTGDVDLATSISTITEKVRLIDASCERVGRDPRSLRRSLLLWPVGGADPWANRGALSEMVERFGPLGFTDFIGFSATPEQQDVFDHVSSEVLPMLRSEPTI